MKIAGLSFWHRDHILLYAWMLMYGDGNAWRAFAIGCSVRKIRRNLDVEDKRSVGSLYKTLLRVHSSVKTNGVLTPIPVSRVGKLITPVNGAKRLASSIACGFRDVPVTFVDPNSKKAKVRDYSLASPMFDNLPEDIRNKFVPWLNEFKGTDNDS